MSKGIFERMRLVEVERDLVRNIVSLRTSQNLFDDLSEAAADWSLAQTVEGHYKPPHFGDTEPVIRRPFEEAALFDAITWPFAHWQASRFSSGRHGVWYGSGDERTTIYETAHHWLHGLLADAGFDQPGVSAERKLYDVRCEAALLDFRPLQRAFPRVLHPDDYGEAQALGARIHRDGHPGLVVPSVRDPERRENYAVFRQSVLSNPRARCYLSYRLEADRIVVEKQRGKTLLTIPRD